jgi:mannose-6-phosphate isomerase-like protein (cupin superfamily)
MHAGDVVDQRSEGERFEVVRSASREGGGLFVIDWTIEPGRHGPPPHVHPHEDETLRVLAGTARIVVNGEVRTVEAGHALRIPAGTPHRVCSAGDSPLTARVTYSGDRFEGVLDRMALGGVRGFVAMGAHVQRDWAAVRPTSAAMRAFMRLLGVVDSVIGRPSRLPPSKAPSKDTAS